MKNEDAERLVSSLESGDAGIEAFLGLRPEDRASIMTTLEQRAWAEELKGILEQCEADGTMDIIRALVAEHEREQIVTSFN